MNRCKDLPCAVGSAPLRPRAASADFVSTDARGGAGGFGGEARGLAARGGAAPARRCPREAGGGAEAGVDRAGRRQH